MKSRARKGLEPAKRGTDLVILVAPQAGRCMKCGTPRFGHVPLADLEDPVRARAAGQRHRDFLTGGVADERFPYW